MDISRREFLKKVFSFSLSLSVGGSLFAFNPFGKGLFEKRPLGKTGLWVSSLGMGQGLEPSLYLYAYEKGMNLIETSRAYRGGVHEEIVGQALKKMDREKIVLLTKVDNAMLQREGWYWGIIKSLEASLKAFGTDYVDILLGHGIDDVGFLANQDVQKAFARLKEEGKIRFCGVSTHKARPIIDWILHKGFYDVVMVGFNCAAPPSASSLLRRAKEAGIGILSMKTLVFNCVNRKEIVPSALRYVVSRNFITSAILLMTNFRQIDENIKALQRPFSKRDKIIIEKNIRPSRIFI